MRIHATQELQELFKRHADFDDSRFAILGADRKPTAMWAPIH
jgi:hypothetical protein